MPGNGGESAKYCEAGNQASFPSGMHAVYRTCTPPEPSARTRATVGASVAASPPSPPASAAAESVPRAHTTAPSRTSTAQLAFVVVNSAAASGDERTAVSVLGPRAGRVIQRTECGPCQLLAGRRRQAFVQEERLRTAEHVSICVENRHEA
jgi:hypothetical protein